MAYLLRKYGIEADVACCEWNRLYRLPGATREEGGKPEDWPTYGDPTSIGTWVPDINVEDIANGVKVSGKKLKSVGEVEQPHGQSSYVGPGIWYHLFETRGWIIGSDGPGKWQVRCPNDGQHSKGSRPEDTVLWAPDAGSTWGRIHCSHAHCVHQQWADWVKYFPETEIRSAKIKCGREFLTKKRETLPPLDVNNELTLGSNYKGDL